MIYNVAFAGTPEFAVKSLEALSDIKNIAIPFVLTQPDKPVGRKQISTSSPVAEYASSHDTTVLKPEHVIDCKETILQTELDAVVVVAYGNMLPEWFLNHPRKGCINIHGSLLPDLRGASPIQTALLRGYDTTGITLQKIAPKIDTGDIITTVSVPIHEDDTYITLSETLSRVAAELLTEVVPRYLENTLQLTPQDESLSRYCSIIKKDDGKIDWSKDDAQSMYNKYRAFIVWPGIWTTWNGKVLKFIKIVPLMSTHAQPGELKIIDTTLVVGTLNHDIAIDTLQLEGKQTVTSEDFIRGYRHQILENPFLS